MIRKTFLRAVAPALLLYAAGAMAQEGSPTRFTVPFSDPARAKTLKVSMTNGSVSVHGYDGKEVAIETANSGSRKSPPTRADGLRRIDNNNTGIEAAEDNNVVKVTAAPWGASNVSIQVPRDTSVIVRVVNSKIEVQGINGEVDVNTINGSVTVTNVSGSVLAHALNGPVKVVLDRVTPDKPMSFSSLNGEIDVTLPANIKANLRLKSDLGEIYSDFDMKVDTTPRQPVVETGKKGARYRVHSDKTMLATVNGGGADIQFTTLNGKVYIRKGK
jgi:DUF4097 and DUF4098 domain-containing protein YvlB